jgi:hypothetical protein
VGERVKGWWIDRSVSRSARQLTPTLLSTQQQVKVPAPEHKMRLVLPELEIPTNKTTVRDLTDDSHLFYVSLSFYVHMRVWVYAYAGIRLSPLRAIAVR